MTGGELWEIHFLGALLLLATEMTGSLTCCTRFICIMLFFHSLFLSLTWREKELFKDNMDQDNGSQT